MDNIDKIAKLITEDPDIFNEGWEELGIEDPKLSTKSTLGIKSIFSEIKRFFDTNYPKFDIGVLNPSYTDDFREKWFFSPANLPEDFNDQVAFYINEVESWKAEGSKIFAGVKKIVEAGGWNIAPPTVDEYQVFLMIMPPGKVWRNTGIKIDDWHIETKSSSEGILRFGGEDPNNSFVFYSLSGTKNEVKFYQEIVFNDPNFDEVEFTVNPTIPIMEITPIFKGFLLNNSKAYSVFMDAMEQAFGKSEESDPSFTPPKEYDPNDDESPDDF